MELSLKCLDQTNALNALVAVLMVLSGGALMGGVAPNLGVTTLSLGFLILALAINDRDLSALKDPLRALKGRRSLLTLVSAASVIVGRLMLHFHIQNLLQENGGDYRVVAELAKDLPVIINVLMYGGLIGLVASLALNKDGGINVTRGALGLVAALAIRASANNLNDAMASGDSQKVNRASALQYASYGLLVLAVSYAC